MKPSKFEELSSSHSPPLDGVRGLAIIMVLMYDCLKLPSGGSLIDFAVRKVASLGWAGVDLFFVLSGFLITGILLETRGRSGYWKSFFIRRSVRIFPLYYFTLLGVFVVLPLLSRMSGSWNGQGRLAAVGADATWYLFYIQNWLFAWRQHWPQERVLNHFWSLAIEEQFYLVWPLVVAWLSRRSLARLCVTLCVVALCLRCGILMSYPPGVVTYVMTITRMDSLAMGALMALAVRHPPLMASASRWFLPGATVLGMGVLVLDQAWPVLRSESLGAYSIGHTLLAMTFALLIAGLFTAPATHPVCRLFSGRVLRNFGKYSYAMYVFHRAAHEIVLWRDWSFLPETGRGWTIFAVTMLLTWAIAWASWHLVEQHFLGLKRWAPRPGEPRQEPARSRSPGAFAPLAETDGPELASLSPELACGK